MKDSKVVLDVLLPASGRDYEFRVPYSLTVETAADLVARMLAGHEPAVFAYEGGADFMRRDGSPAGQLLRPKETIGALVARGDLVDGSPLVLV